MTAPDRDALVRRVAALSDRQRALLAGRLGLTDPPSGRAMLVAWAETGEAVADELRDFLASRLPAAMVPGVVVTLGELPRLASGKVDRNALPAPATHAAAGPGDFVAPRNEVERILASIWAQVLGVTHVGANDNFFELGGDSLLSIRVLARARQAGLTISPKQFVDAPTIAQLAGLIDAPPPPPDAGPVTGSLPLTPIQHWFFDRVARDPHHWNQAILLEARQPIEPGALREALVRLVEHHDALRLRFEPGDEGRWQATNAPPPGAVDLLVEDLSSVPLPERRVAVHEVASRLHARMDLSRGLLLQAALLRSSDAWQDRLLLVVHHLAIDPLSWNLLVEDLERVYGAQLERTTVALPARTASYLAWARSLHEHAQTASAKAEAGFWLEAIRDIVRLPLDRTAAPGENTTATARHVACVLDTAWTAQLRDVQRTRNTGIHEVLLTSLALALAEWTGVDRVVVDVEAHGRELVGDADLDLSRTVGWFTSVFPVALTVRPGDEPMANLVQVRETLRRIPGKGIGHGLLRYLCRDERSVAALRSAPCPDVNFNYMGDRADSGPTAGRFRVVPGNWGEARSPNGLRPHVLEVNTFLQDGALHAVWTYSDRLHDRATVERLADRFMTTLRDLIRACLDRDARLVTPADFPLARLDQAQLDRVADLLARADHDDPE